jgi:hypothetical protein
MRRIRTGLATGLALLTLTTAAAGCSSSDSTGGDGDGNDQPIEGVVTEPAGPEGTEDDTEGSEDPAVAALKDLYDAYWDTVIELENGGRLDVAVFDGIATPGVAEDEVGRLHPFRDDNIHREGEPTIDNVTVTIDDDTARIQSCKSEAGWNFFRNDDELTGIIPDEARRPHPFVVSAERTSGEWLINGTLRPQEATITC